MTFDKTRTNCVNTIIIMIYLSTSTEFYYGDLMTAHGNYGIILLMFTPPPALPVFGGSSLTLLFNHS